MTSALLMDILKVSHGSFNTLLALASLYQAWLGLSVRQGRMGGEPRFSAMRMHRRLGPWLVAMGLMGFCFGLMLVVIDKGKVFAHPLHFAAGSLIAVFLLAQYGISRKIRGAEPAWRGPHLAVGVNILFLYLVQIVLGFEILL
jgi:hypothetical protein